MGHTRINPTRADMAGNSSWSEFGRLTTNLGAEQLTLFVHFAAGGQIVGVPNQAMRVHLM